MVTNSVDIHPEVSVIIPMYNAGKYISRTIGSILAQTFRDFIIIVIDDCSTDDSVEKVRAFDDARIKLLLNEKNIGAGLTRNRGIMEAKTRYIAFCDSDDLMVPDRLIRQYEFMEANPDMDICGTFTQIIDDNDNPVGKYKFPIDHEHLKVRMFSRCAFQQSTAFIRLESFRKAGIMYKGNHYAEDFDIWSNTVFRLKFHVIPEYLTCYRIRPNQLSDASLDNQRRDAMKVYASMMDRLGVKYDDRILHIQYELAHKRGERIPKSWLPDYERFCHDCISQNKKKKLYDSGIWDHEVVHNYRKSQHLYHSKFVCTLKAIFKFWKL